MIYFHIDELSRDAIVAGNLKAILAERGVKLHYGNRAESEIMRLFNTSSGFDLCIFPSLDQFKNTCPNPSTWTAPVLILPGESVGGTSTNIERLAAKYIGSYSEESKEWVAKVWAFCLWGPSHLKAVSKEHYARCHVVGHPRYDLRCLGEKKTHPKIHIGLISRFAGLNDFAGRSMLQSIWESRKLKDRVAPVYRQSPDKNIEDRLYVETMDLRHLFEIIESLPREKYSLHLRIHHREDRKHWERWIKQNRIDIKLADWAQPFMHWVADKDYVIGPVSTTFYDCMVAGVQPICTMDLEPKRQDHILKGGDDENPLLKFVWRPHSMEELLERISLKANPLDIPLEAQQILYQETVYPECRWSLATINGVIASLNLRSSHNPAIYLKHQALSFIEKLYRTGKVEQNGTFRLTRKRKRWIDRLSDCPTPINHERLAGHVGGRIGGEEEKRPGEVFR